MKQFVLFWAGIFAVIVLNACKAVESDTAEETELAYICIGAETSRTITPNLNFNIDSLTHFTLYGQKTKDEGEVYLNSDGFGENNSGKSYENLLKAKFIVSTGTWCSFRLTAYDEDNGISLSGTILNKKIVHGKNTLDFVLEPTDGSGYIKVTFKISSATAVKKVKIGLYETDSEKAVRDATLTVTPSEEDDSATAIYDYGTVGSGSYRLKAWFYADEGCSLLVSKYSEIIKIFDKKTSTAEREITELNPVYKIIVNNPDVSYSSGEPKTSFTRYDENVILPTKDNMTKYKDGSYYTFMGWYENAEGSGEKLTEIPSSRCENVVLYGIWKKNCRVDFYCHSGNFGEYPDSVDAWQDTFFVLEGTVLTSEQLSEVSNEDGYIFAGWYDSCEYEDGMYIWGNKVSAGEYTVTDDTRLYAKWTKASSITIEIPKNIDISLTSAQNGSSWTLTAETDFENYSWRIDDTKQSETGNILIFDTANWTRGFYEVTVEAEKDEEFYSARAYITVGGN